MKGFNIQGFEGNRRVKEVQHEHTHWLPNTMVGYRLDEIQLNIVIKSKADLEYLMKFAQYAMPCFNKDN